MTESSSAGNPDGAALPPDHPLGPAVPIPPLEKEARRGQDLASGAGAAGRPDAADEASGVATGKSGASPGTPVRGDGGRPGRDRRENAIDPSPGSARHRGTSIRDEQHTHEAGVVPAAYIGAGTPDEPDEQRHPEDAILEPDSWDSDAEKD